ncbi:unnamed protein product, partial [Heterotrigona itama]
QASRPKIKEDRKTAIEEACNKWLILRWMGNTSKELLEIHLKNCYYFVTMPEFRICS